MRTSRTLAVLFTAGVATLAIAAAIGILGCGPPCIDDRCSLSAPTSQTTKVDYTKPASSGTSSTGSAAPATGSAAPAAGSAVATAGSGSAKPPPAAGSAAPIAAGSGSAAPPVKPPDPPAAMSGSWELWASNNFKMYVISKAAVAANTKVSFDIVKAPAKTPFVITLEVLPPGGLPGSEGVWNDCPEGKIRCDSAGTKTHVTKKAGQVLVQAGINWAVTGISDESKGTLVTWTNNLSREVVQLRLLK